MLRTFTKNTMAGVACFVALSVSTSGYSAIYDFDAIYDGTDIASVGVDTPIGTVLAAGDSFNYNVQAAGEDYWSVDTTNDFFPFLAFTIQESGDRIGDMSLSLFLDGILQSGPFTEFGISNSQVHLGTNSVHLASGLMFDEIVLDFFLISSFDLDPITPLANTATIIDLSIGPHIPGGFGAGISYVDVTTVPVPAAVWLFGSGLLGLFGIARRKKAA